MNMVVNNYLVWIITAGQGHSLSKVRKSVLPMVKRPHPAQHKIINLFKHYKCGDNVLEIFVFIYTLIVILQNELGR